MYLRVTAFSSRRPEGRGSSTRPIGRLCSRAAGPVCCLRPGMGTVGARFLSAPWRRAGESSASCRRPLLRDSSGRGNAQVERSSAGAGPVATTCRSALCGTIFCFVQVSAPARFGDPSDSIFCLRAGVRSGEIREPNRLDPASPCEGAVPGTRHDTDGRYV